MNIIPVSSRRAKSGRLYSTGRQIDPVLLLSLGVALMVAVSLQFTLPRAVPGGLESIAIKPGGTHFAEFSFDQLTEQGTLAPVGGAMTGLEQQLDALRHLIGDRADEPVALDALMHQNPLGRAMLPTSAPLDAVWSASNFGWRTDPYTGRSAMHEGIDYVAKAGTPIHASGGGVVVYANTHPQYGNMVEVDHGNDIVTRYAHASRLLVRVGQVVHRGDLIAEVGSTGRSTGNHLHFEVRYKGSAQNPVRFLQSVAG